MRKLNTKEFIEKSKLVHNDNFIYDKVIYISSNKKVKIICKEHGEFEQEANSHLRGIGCSKCSGNRKSNKDEFVKKSNEIHNFKYDYSLVEYKNSFKKVKIICKEHGIFEQSPNNHLNLHGCEKCGYNRVSICNSNGLEKFILDSNILHKNKYDYSLVEYKNNRTKVKIICKEHGLFEQSPANHLKTIGCKRCSIDLESIKKTKTKATFIDECIKSHNNVYDYSLIEYKGTNYKVKIICKEHGIFEQRPYKHLQGQGCPTCSESKLEKEVRLFLDRNYIKYISQYSRKDGCIFIGNQSIDFYLPDYKIAIECQGDQHFIPVDFGNKGKEYSYEKFKKIILNDFRKYLKCIENNVKVLYYSKEIYSNDKYISNIYSNIDELLKEINECK